MNTLHSDIATYLNNGGIITVLPDSIARAKQDETREDIDVPLNEFECGIAMGNIRRGRA